MSHSASSVTIRVDGLKFTTKEDLVKIKNNLTKIVFIDDGINPVFVPDEISFSEFIANTKGVYVGIDPTNTISHGTMCYQIFQNEVRHPYHLISIKILDDATGTGNKEALLSALAWCAEQNIDLINMSIGTRQYLDFEVIANAIKKLPNTIIIAACSNQNELTFPACMKSVIGVRHCAHEKLQGEFVYLSTPYDQINILTNANNMQFSFGENQHIGMSGANSFATPLITARICNYMNHGFTNYNAVKQKLQLDSQHCTEFQTFDFNKKLFFKWEEISVPVIIVSCELPGNKKELPCNLKALVMEFVKDGYRAVCLTTETETSAQEFIFKLAEYNGQTEITDLISLHYNFLLPDLIFLHISSLNLLETLKNMTAEILLKSSNTDIPALSTFEENYVLDLNHNHLYLFNQIKKLLSYKF